MAEDYSKSKPIIKAASACVWRGDEVLLIQRASTLGRGLWSLPGGKQEPGESGVENAHRELLEETGIAARLEHDLGHFEIDVGEITYCIRCFAGPYVSGDAFAASDAGAVAWVHFNDVALYQLAPNVSTAIAAARNLIKL